MSEKRVDPDAGLVEKAQTSPEGDLRAFERLVEKHREKILASCRYLTRNIIAGFYAKSVLEVGERVEIGNLAGVLKAITTTHTLIESDGQTVSVSNSAFLDQVSKQ